MINIGSKQISQDDFYKILFEKESIVIDDAVIQRAQLNFDFLKEFSHEKLIYGINTGFGPMAQYSINRRDQVTLQYNLIRSHCSGAGRPIDELDCRAVMIARLNMLAQGYSGVHPNVIILLTDLINKNISPVIYEHGGLGASGDLVQLAHLALCLLGEGEVHYRGEITDAKKIFEKESLAPMKVQIREGLALINGTSSMSGIGVLNIVHAENLVNWTVMASACIMEIVRTFNDHYSVPLNEKKRHAGQLNVSFALQSILGDSRLVRKREWHPYAGEAEAVRSEKMQEYYSIRCVPQIAGPVLDTILNAKEIVFNEINSVNDNPIVDHENQNIYHGGNFHGDYVALEMDKLKIAITKLSMLSERQLNFLLNDKLNSVLPPFVNLGVLGLNLGMQGVQFTATSTTAENQTLSNPMYVHSIPSNNDNQDIVSMGTNSALLCRKVILNTYEVLAIQWMTILQAVDHLKIEDKLSSKTKEAYIKLRKVFPVFKEDNIRYKEVKAVRDHLFNDHLKILS